MRNFFIIGFFTLNFNLIANFASSSDDLLEPLLGVRRTKSGLSFQVRSSGCTNKNNFAVVVNRKNNMYEIEAERVRTDNCELMTPEGIELFYAFSELGIPVGAQYRIVNSVVGIVSE